MGNDSSMTLNVFGKDVSGSKVLKDVGQEAEGLKGKLKTIAGVAGAAGAAGGAALAASWASNSSLEVGNDKLAAQLGLTAQEADKAGKAAGAVYGDNWGESMDDVNAAVQSVGTNLADVSTASQGEIQGLTEKALALSSTFDQDVNSSTMAAGQLIKTGLAKNATEAFDIITAGFQNGVNKSDDFLDTLNEYGTQFRKLGIDGETATGLLSQGLKAGARDGDLVADAIKEFSIRAVDGSKATADGFKAVGLNGKEMTEAIAKGGPEAQAALAKTLDGLRGIKDPALQAQAATALFGTQAEDLGAALFALHPETAAAGLGEVAGAADKMAATVGDNAAGKVETFKRKMEGMLQSLTQGDSALGVAAASVSQFGGGVLTSGSQLAVMATALKGTALATKTATVAQWALNVAMSANPIGLVVIAIAAVVAALVLLWQHSDTAKRIMVAAFKWIANVFFDMVSGITDGAAKAFGWVPGIGDKLKGAAKKFQEFRDSVNAKLDGINDETVNVTVKVRQTGGLGDFSQNGISVRAMEARADGGPVYPGTPYRVGEEGEEIFWPTQAGTIIPNQRSRGGGFGGGDVHVHVYGQVISSNEALRVAVKNGVQDGMARGRT